VDSHPAPAIQTIGRYRVLKELGKGGMGVVYLAIRDDEVARKRVAIKVIRQGLDTNNIIRRFRNERRALAALEHPHIARFLDGGTTEDGRPYFVIEYIEGQPIDDFCDTHRLSLRERLELFLKLCSAVHYAHQNLIVHRDLKPDNVLVTADGSPKLLDFGIAKLLNPEMALQTVDLTSDRMWMMTPAYASPEQVRGLPITIASDVYSLGIMLYELLTGQRPYHFKNYTPTEIERVVCEQEPARPSDTLAAGPKPTNGAQPGKIPPEQASKLRGGLSPEKLQKQLAGDLDNIILKALAKEPQRRYSSVQEFSQDLQRFLQGLPVHARPATVLYRARKFVKRHRMGVVAGLLVVLSLVAGMAGIMWQAHIAAIERDKARDEAAKANQINQFLQDMLSAADPMVSGKKVTVAEVLASAAKRIESALANQPAVKAEVYATLGQAYLNLGMYDQAEELMQRALRIRRKLFAENSPEIAESLKNLAVALRKKGRAAEAKPLFLHALEIYRNLHAENSLEYAKLLNDYALLLDENEQYAEAEKLLRQALAIEKGLLGTEDKDVLGVNNNLAHVLWNRGLYDAAEPYYRDALHIAEKIHDPRLYIYLNNMATLLQNQQKYAAADTFFRRSLVIQQDLLGQQHPHVARVLQNMAANAFYQGHFSEADSLLQQSIQILRITLPANHRDWVYTLWWQGRILNAGGKAKQAETVLRRALQIGQHALPANNWLLTYSRLALGKSLFLQGKYAAAESLLVPAYRQLQKTPGDNRQAIRRALDYLVQLYKTLGQPAKAARYENLRAALE
ncbi:MAG: tetratricopeptide repeat protein, partial [Calditrichaeota bacterium]